MLFSALMLIPRQVTDLPSISHFPRTPDAEWTDFRFFGLRSASAYLFVYDASDAAATFDVVRTLREQGTLGAADGRIQAASGGDPDIRHSS